MHQPLEAHPAARPHQQARAVGQAQRQRGLGAGQQQVATAQRVAGRQRLRGGVATLHLHRAQHVQHLGAHGLLAQPGQRDAQLGARHQPAGIGNAVELLQLAPAGRRAEVALGNADQGVAAHDAVAPVGLGGR